MEMQQAQIVKLPVRERKTDSFQILAEHNRNLVKTARKQRQQYRKLVEVAAAIISDSVPVYNSDQPAQNWIIPAKARNQLLAALFVVETEESIHQPGETF